MPEFIPFQSRTVSAKLTVSEHEKLIEVMKSIYGDQMEAVTFREILTRLIHSYNPEGSAQVQENHELFKAQNEITLLQGEISSYKQALEIANFEKVEAYESLKEINDRQNQRGETIQANAVVVSIEPLIDHFLVLQSEAASRKMKKEFTRADVLKNLFWDQIIEGPGDHLPLIIKRSEVVKVISDLKEKERIKAEEGQSNV